MMETIDPFAENGAPPEKKPAPAKPAKWVTAPIEQVLRNAWGDEVYERSAFHQMAVSELEREHSLKPRPKKGK